MIVLELCRRSLRFQVRSHPEEAPARLPRKAALNKVFDWALNILDALRYIHDEGFTHRDLKLDNIFVSWRDNDWHMSFFLFSKHFRLLSNRWTNSLI